TLFPYTTLFRSKAVLVEAHARPVVVLPPADHELDLVRGLEGGDIAVQIAAELTGTRCLQIENHRHPGLDCLDGQGAAGLEGYPKPGVAQPRQQWQALRLRQGLTAGDGDIGGIQLPHLIDDVVEGLALTAVEGVFGIAVQAAQGAAGEAHEHRGQAHGAGLPLEGIEDFGDAQGVFHGGIIPALARHGCNRAEGEEARRRNLAPGNLRSCPAGRPWRGLRRCCWWRRRDRAWPWLSPCRPASGIPAPT